MYFEDEEFLEDVCLWELEIKYFSNYFRWDLEIKYKFLWFCDVRIFLIDLFV